MKSTLSITLGSTQPFHTFRTIKVPCRLPEAFNFNSGGRMYTATINTNVSGRLADTCVDLVEFDGAAEPSAGAYEFAARRSEAILATIKAALGITGPVPPGSPLPAIALAYEAEVAAYEALTSAHLALPASVRRFGHVPTHPGEDGATGNSSYAARMLAKYVEHVVEQAAKVTP